MTSLFVEKEGHYAIRLETHDSASMLFRHVEVELDAYAEETPEAPASPTALSSSAGEWQTWPMKSDTPSYHGYRFPPEIISHAVWLYHRIESVFQETHQLKTSLNVIATDRVVIVDPDIDARSTVGDPVGRFYRHVQLSAKRPTCRAALRHSQRSHPSVIAVQSELAPPPPPWLHRRQQSANSVPLNLTRHPKVDLTVDAQCLERRMVQMLLEHADQEVAHSNIRTPFGVGLETIRRNLKVKPLRGKHGQPWMDDLQLRVVCGVLRQKAMRRPSRATASYPFVRGGARSRSSLSAASSSAISPVTPSGLPVSA